MSVIAYGILWRWLNTRHDWTKRYGGIILDELADLTPQRELTVRMIFDEQKQMDESARVHIVATSSSITPVYLKTVGNLYDCEFDVVFVSGRKLSMERCMVIPEQENKLLESMASMIVSALKRDDHYNNGDIIGFLPGFLRFLNLSSWCQRKLRRAFMVAITV